MSKNIVIFADGTGQEGGLGNNTNVYDLFNMIEDRTDRQISFYDRGLGTGRAKLGSITGAGITKNIQECYQFISDQYAAGDRIYLFGFSRGATTVRTLSAFIHLFGILPRSRPELIRRAWRIYKIGNHEKRRKRANDFLHLNHTMWARVRFLGVWDTVAALGLPLKTLDVLIDNISFFQHSFHDLRLAESVEYARHALAVDDERRTFHPRLWDERGESEDQELDEGDVRHFDADDISDIYLVAEKLKAEEHPVTKRLDLPKSLRQKLNAFDRRGKRSEPESKITELKAGVLREFNKAVFNANDSIYDPESADEFEGIALSAETKNAITRFRRKRKGVRWLDRLLIEDAYSLRPARIPRVKQVWFAGMHTDVGGGYPDNHLAHIPLVWMIKEAQDLGLRIYPKHHVDLSPDALAKMHNSREGLGRLYRKRRRQWNREQNQGRSPLVHESVIMRSRADDTVYEPWILKTRYNLEPWPRRLASSVQFDDHHIWREAFWGWDGAFAVPWGAIERIAADEQLGTITLFLKGKRDDIVIKGCIPENLTSLVSELERRREHKRLEEEDERLRSQDRKLEQQDQQLKQLLSELKDKVATLEHHIQTDEDQTGKLKKRDTDLTKRDRELASEIKALKDKIEGLEQAGLDPRQADDDRGGDLVKN